MIAQIPINDYMNFAHNHSIDIDLLKNSDY